VPFAGKLKIIDFALSNCVNSGVRRIGVLTQYKAQSLIRHIERGWSFLAASLGEYVDVVPAQQQHGELWYSGTANAVYQNLSILREARPKLVLILGGDHIYKMDYAVVLAEHVARGAGLTVACLEVPIEQATVRRSILFSKVRVAEGSVIKDSVVLPNVHIGRNVALRRTVIANHCRLPDDFRAGFDAAHDAARGFHVTERGITLITPEMIGQPLHAAP
jgi:ADP-glucose pyrophosphorylase